MDAMNLSLY